MNTGGTQVPRQRLFPAACLLCAIPVLVATYPPMVDAPQHAAQVESVRAYLEGRWIFAPLFELKLFTPYWLGYGIVYLLAGAVGIVWGTKLAVASAACALPLVVARFCNRAGTDPRWNWLFLLLPFGYAYDWGFLNFYVALPFAFVFLHAVLEHRDAPSRRTCVAILLWLHFLFFAHVLVTAFTCVIALLLLGGPWQGARHWIRSSLPVLGVLPITLTWTAITFGNVGATELSLTFWDHGLHRLVNLPPMLVATPTTLPGYLVAFFALATPRLTGARLATPWRWLPFAFYLAWMLFFAHHIFGNSHTYQRFGNIGLPLYLLCFRPATEVTRARRDTIAALGVAVVAISMLGWATIRAAVFNAETRAYSNIMAAAQPGRRVLMLMMDSNSRASDAPLFLHFPAWYQAERGGLAEFNFARFDVTPLSYRDPAASRIGIGFEWRPHTFNWSTHKGELYDYIVVRSPMDQSTALYAISDCRVSLLANDEPWWLYAKVPDEAGRQKACRN